MKTKRVNAVVPEMNDELRRRMINRYGAAVESWLEAQPAVLSDLAKRWNIQLIGLIPSGNMSVVVQCQLPDGVPGVLKLCPDKKRLASEAGALKEWQTNHVPSVLAVDTHAGALLIEGITPGTAFNEFTTYPAAQVADLLTELHEHGPHDLFCPPLSERVTYLFDSWSKHREKFPELKTVVTPKVFESGRRMALRLAERASPMVLLHGDLTPRNVLDGGPGRGLVAIDPAPCLGDAAFDAIDLLMWRADDIAIIERRAEQLAPALDVETSLLIDWCVAFAGMNASELAAEPTGTAAFETALELAYRESS